MKNDQSKMRTVIMAVFILVIVSVLGVVGLVASISGGKSREPEPINGVDDPYEYPKGDDLETLLKKVRYTEPEPIKAPVSFDEVSLFDEMPEIEKYPLVVEGRGAVDIEIFSSGEKASLNPVSDSWLIQVADKFNASGAVTSDGRQISLSVRSVPSGTAADYIISEKYLPDLYTPSNELFGMYAIGYNGKLELYAPRLVGNTAGVLVDQSSTLSSLNGVLDLVTTGSFNFGYTNPQTSATGLNLLIELLKSFGNGDISSTEAADAFTKFNDNIPYIAYTTQQMRDGASRGGLNGMVSEYQAYINDEALKSRYKFVPFGQRHDNPLYIIDKAHKSDAELEAIEQIYKFMMSAEMQELATQYGYNANDDYASSYECNTSEVLDSLSIYKNTKDAGKTVYAVFVADRSGSMDGDAILQLKDSLSNGMNYINEGNYVGLVSYSSDITIDLPLAKFDLTQKAYFQGALNRMDAVGGTDTYEALCVAVHMLEEATKDVPNAKKMIFLLSDGNASGRYTLSKIEYMLRQSEIPVYTIGYTEYADTAELSQLSAINEAASISADTDDVVYKIKSLFNAQL